MEERLIEGLAARLLRHLPPDGTPVGNASLRKKLATSGKKFQDARDELLRLGYVEVGKGRGGSLRLVKGATQAIELPSQFEELKSLVRATSAEARTENAQRRNPSSSLDEEFENKAWRLIYSLKPSHITTGRKPPVKLSSGTMCPDTVALFSSYVGQLAVVLECKYSAKGPYPDAYLSDWISRLREHRGDLRKLFLEKLKLHKLIVVAAVNDVSEIPSRIRSEGTQLGVRWLDSKQVSYFQKAHDESGIGIGHLFWSSVAPETIYLKDKEVPGMRIRAGQGSEAYIFSANAHDLLGRAYVSHRELQAVQDQTAYQRMFKKAKLKAISDYIKTYSTFPTPIVVAFDEKSGQVFEKDAGRAEVEGVTPGRIRLPNRAKSMQVIDGQHRLYGYTLVEPDPAHVIHVVAYKSTKEMDAARLFVEINGKQTPVPKNLLWELYPDIYKKDDPDYYKAMISSAAEDQVKEHLMGRVRHTTLHSEGEITFQTLCKEVERLKLVKKKGGLLAAEFEDEESRQRKLSLILDAFFTTLEGFEKDYAEVSQIAIYTNVGLIPMIRICGRILKYEHSRGTPNIFQNKNMIVQTLKSYFGPIYAHYQLKGREALKTMISGKSSEGGFNLLDDELTKVIQERYRSDFPARQTASSPALEEAVEDVARTMDRINELALRTYPGHWIFREFASKTFAKKLKRRDFDEDSFLTAVRRLHQEMIEGTYSETGANSLLDLLKVSKIDQVPILDELNLLRNYTSHKKLSKDERMTRALHSLRRLAGRNDFYDASDLTSVELETALITLLKELSTQALNPALTNLKFHVS